LLLSCGEEGIAEARPRHEQGGLSLDDPKPGGRIVHFGFLYVVGGISHTTIAVQVQEVERRSGRKLVLLRHRGGPSTTTTTTKNTAATATFITNNGICAKRIPRRNSIELPTKTASLDGDCSGRLQYRRGRLVVLPQSICIDII